MESAHGGEVLLVFVAFKQLFDSFFNAVGYILEPVFV